MLSRYLLFILSIIFIYIGHNIKIWRWSLIAQKNSGLTFKYFSKAIGFSYILNIILPFNSGEIFRALIVSKKGKFFLNALLTIMIEKIFDIIFTLLVLLGLVLIYYQQLDFLSFNYQTSILLYILLFSSFLIFSYFFLFKNSTISNLIFASSKFLTPKINTLIIKEFNQASYFFYKCFVDLNLIRISLISIVMWIFYISGYYTIYRYLNIDFELNNFLSNLDFYLNLNNKILIETLKNFNNFINLDSAAFIYFLFYTIPAFLIYLDPIKKLNKINPTFDVNFDLNFVNLSDHFSFLNMANQIKKLESKILLYESFGHNLSIEDVSGLSGAFTYKITRSTNNSFKKIGFENNCKEISNQITWMRTNANKSYAPEIINVFESDFFSTYEMIEDNRYTPLLNYIFTLKSDEFKHLSTHLLATIDNAFSSFSPSISLKEQVRIYLDSKFLKNSSFIKKRCYEEQFLNSKVVTINSIQVNNFLVHNDSIYTKLYNILTNETLQVSHHGDFSPDNILYNPSDGMFKFIDPNILNSIYLPFLDHSKIFYTLNSYLNFLRFASIYQLNKNSIVFSEFNIQAFDNFKKSISTVFTTKYGDENYLKMRIHSFIHGLRVTTRRLQLGDDKWPVYFAKSLIEFDSITKVI